MTGRHPLTLGWQLGESMNNYDYGLGLNETTIAEVLKSNGYTTYMLGKWNLGNKSPRYLPTARGFDYFLGFMNGYNYYWSKRDPSNPDYEDIMYSNTDCYHQYDGDDVSDYSTLLYKDWAVQFIDKHDFEQSPMFMYLAFQAVHDPFADYNDHQTGLDSGIMDAAVYDYIQGNINVSKWN
jgi:arylsulfatase B/arylsulfatase I/J